jgi:hypothetical protein
MDNVVHQPIADVDENEKRQPDELRVILAGVVAHTLETLLNEAQNRHAVPTQAVSTLAQCLVDAADERDACNALSLRKFVNYDSKLPQTSNLSLAT